MAPRKNAKPDRPIRMLLLVGDLYGLNCTSDSKKLSILEKMRRYGWELTTAGIGREVHPCAFGRQHGAEPMALDSTVSEIGDVSRFDGISVLPGPAFKANELIREGFHKGLVISGWCRGVRVLAAADIVRGKRVVGHADDREAIQAAGGVYLGNDHPPVIDGTLVTGVRSYFYRAQTCDAIRAAIQERSRGGESG
jgi:hypothetical protein